MWMKCASFCHAWRHERALESLMFFNVAAAFKPLLVCQFRALQFFCVFFFLMLWILALIQLLPNSVKSLQQLCAFGLVLWRCFASSRPGNSFRESDCIANLPGSSPICEPSLISCLVMAEFGFCLVSSWRGFCIEYVVQIRGNSLY